MVRGVAVVARRPEARLVRVGRPRARRWAAEQLGERVRRSGVDARRADRPVLPPQLPRRAARPQLVERGGARAVRPHLPVLVRRRRDGLPDRRRPHGHQGPGPARQPARRPRRRRVVHGAACAGSVRSSTRCGPRCTTCTGAGGRSPTPTTRPGCSWARRSSSASTTCSRSSRADQLHLDFNIPFAHAPFERRGAARHDRTDRGRARRAARRCGRGATTTSPGSRRAGPAAIRTRRGAR